MFQYFKSSSKKANRSLVIGLISSRSDTKTQVQALASKGDGIAIKFVTGAAVSGNVSQSGVNVIVYDLDIASEQALDAFEQFMHARPASLPVIALADSADDEFVRWLMQLRVSDWVRPPVTSGELLSACGRAVSSSTEKSTDIKCLAFIGAKGGVGTTTVALHAALALSRKNKHAKPPCVVDLDFASSSCADYLDLEPGWQIDELIADPTRLDSHMFKAMIANHRSGISVLSARRKFGDSKPIPEDLITKPMDLAAQQFGVMVIDVPRSAGPWLDNVVAGATDLFVVTEFTVPGLKLARNLVNQIVETYGAETKPRVIVNKYERSFFGSNLSSTEAKELLGPYLAGFINTDVKLVSEAINRGVFTTDIKPSNKIFSSISKIVGELA
jgi:pilus assembly protein CpaE